MKKNILFNTFYLLGLLLGGLVICLSPDTVLSNETRSPSSIIALPDNENLILVEKKTQTLFLYTSHADDLSIRFQVPCSTGEVLGNKLTAGDKKTPEGIYFLLDEYEDKYLSPVYGKKAFPTDYPNLLDRRKGKNGSAIWIHGTNKALRPMDSNGCIALENSDILKLSDYITLDSTPVIMVQEIIPVEKEVLKRQADDIHHLVKQWADATINGTYHQYLSLYSSEYLPDISWWDQWRELRKKAIDQGIGLGMETDNTGIYHHDDVFVVLFDVFFTSQTEKVFLGKRKFFLQTENNTYKIIGDIYQRISKALKKAKTPLLLAAQTIAVPVSKQESVITMLNSWLAAWSSKEMDKYASFYSDQFFSDGMGKKKWVGRKQRLAKKYEFINVSGSQFKIKQGKTRCDVSFFQDYESSGLTTQGTKKLTLVKKGGLWKIYRESWKEKSP